MLHISYSRIFVFSLNRPVAAGIFFHCSLHFYISVNDVFQTAFLCKMWPIQLDFILLYVGCFFPTSLFVTPHSPHTIGLTDLNLSPAPHFNTFNIFLINIPNCPSLTTIKLCSKCRTCILVLTILVWNWAIWQKCLETFVQLRSLVSIINWYSSY